MDDGGAPGYSMDRPAPMNDQRIANLEKQIADIRAGKDIAFTEMTRRILLGRIIDAGDDRAPTSNENTTTNLGPAGGSVLHAKQYDRVVEVFIDGDLYYLGLYQ